jgi:two-component system, NtrC family, nitrogen regulation response regulator GlnG
MNKVDEVWIVDDDRSIRWVLEKALDKAGIKSRTYSSADVLLENLNGTLPDAIITDIRMPGMDGLSLLKRIQETNPGLPVIVMTAHSDLESAVSAFHGGAFEYLPKPFDIDEAVDRVQRACTQARNLRLQRDPVPSDEATPEIIGAAPAMQEVFRAIARLARSHITVLINGESGTGKELVAKALHRHSPRASQPFIALNMAAIPRDLLESELFGHERGAFTGAQARRAGRFEQADGGTLFLDEIGDMPAELQTRLLRVLADGEFFPIGAHAPVKVDVRIIAATHQNLDQLVAEGRFREDLYHRLNVIRIHLPPLRERRQDIPLLLKHFLLEASNEIKGETKELKPDVEEFLCTLDWPGNVRQLENTCRWITVMAAGKDVHMDDLPPELLHIVKEAPASFGDGNWQEALKDWIVEELRLGHVNLAKEAIESAESILIRTALSATRGRRQEAAKLLGYGRNTLTRKIAELQLDV